jgi:hypothetical protein
MNQRVQLDAISAFEYRVYSLICVALCISVSLSSSSDL